MYAEHQWWLLSAGGRGSSRAFCERDSEHPIWGGGEVLGEGIFGEVAAGRAAPWGWDFTVST